MHRPRAPRIPDSHDADFLLFYLRYRDRLYRNWRELCLYIPFLFFYSWSLLASRGLFGPGFHLSTAVRDLVAENEWNQGPDEGPLYHKKTWEDVSSGDDVWTHLAGEAGFQRLFNTTNILNGACFVVGPIRVQQTRVQQTPCDDLTKYTDATSAYRQFPCYPPYTDSAEATEDLGDLNRCGIDSPLGLIGVSGFKLYIDHQDSPIAAYPGLSSGTRTVTGRLTDYPLNKGYVFDVWPAPRMQALARGIPGTNPSTANAKFECMRDSGWIDAATRLVSVTGFVYNPAQDLFARWKLLAEVAETGRFVPSVHVTLFRIIRPDSVVVVIREGIIFIYIFYFFVLFCADAWNHRSRPLDYIRSLWTLVDLFVLVTFIVVYGGRIWFWFEPGFEFDVRAASPQVIKDFPAAQQPLYVQLATFERLQGYADQIDGWNGFFAISALFMFMKLFKFMRVDPRFSLLSDTMRHERGPLLTFFFYFGTLLVGFGLMTMLMYGNNLVDFSTLFRCQVSLLRFMVGDYDYGALREVDNTFTPFFFVAFMTSVWLLVLNIVIGIVADGYSKAKRKQEEIVGPVSWLKQRSRIQRVGRANFAMRLLRKNPEHLADLKEKSPIQWNRINSLGLSVIINVLHQWRKRRRQEQLERPIWITKEDIAAEWRHHKATSDLQAPKDGHSIAMALWELLDTDRESLNTAIVLFNRGERHGAPQEEEPEDVEEEEKKQEETAEKEKQATPDGSQQHHHHPSQPTSTDPYYSSQDPYSTGDMYGSRPPGHHLGGGGGASRAMLSTVHPYDVTSSPSMTGAQHHSHHHTFDHPTYGMMNHMGHTSQHGQLPQGPFPVRGGLVNGYHPDEVVRSYIDGLWELEPWLTHHHPEVAHTVRQLALRELRSTLVTRDYPAPALPLISKDYRHSTDAAHTYANVSRG